MKTKRKQFIVELEDEDISATELWRCLEKHCDLGVFNVQEIRYIIKDRKEDNED
jgi:hypothetical protein